MMKTTLLPVLAVVFAGCSRAFGQADATPVATPADVPMPLVQPSPSATPEVSPSAAPMPVAQPTPPIASPTPTATDQAMPAIEPRPTPSPTATCAECAMRAEAPKPVESDENVLAKLEQDWGEAIARHDVDFLERTESDDYIYTGPDGVVSHKFDEIAGAKTEFAQVESFKHRDIKTHVYGDTAVVTGATTLKGTAGDTDLSGEFRWTDVFVKRDGRWQVVASQATAISKPDATD